MTARHRPRCSRSTAGNFPTTDELAPLRNSLAVIATRSSRRTSMARTDGDTWDLASSVGATATGVAASRALASKQPTRSSTIRSPTHWSSAVGLELPQPNGRWRTGVRRRSAREQRSGYVSRSRYARVLRRLLHQCRRGGNPAGGHPRRLASTPAPTGCDGRRMRWCSRSTSRRSSSSSPAC